MLDRLYGKFDDLVKKHELFKVETIGDAYMCVGNLRSLQPDHAHRVARFAMDAVNAAKSTLGAPRRCVIEPSRSVYKSNAEYHWNTAVPPR